MNRKHVVSISSGVPSAIAAHITLEEQGTADLVFMDTLIEHPDNYRFLDDLERFWNVPIIRLSKGLTPRDVAENEKMIFNQRIALCTRVLKIEPFLEYLRSIPDLDVTVVLGMDASDKRRGRLLKPVLNYGKLGYAVHYPLVAKRRGWEGQALHDMVKSWGIKVPETYGMNFKHANCLDPDKGGCFKFGMGDMERLKTHFPRAFQEFKRWELSMIERHELEGHGLLRQTVKGETNYITLAEFEQQLQSTQQLSFFDLLDELSGNDCRVECGVSNIE